jgi:antitoxin (DNA-binding transcriptional repressor) of toxin-antitoxin stability system
MAAMKHVGVREFRDHATLYLSGGDPIAVTKHDRVIGIYVPFKRDEEKARQAWDSFGATIDRILQETGMTEDELADLFDVSKPFPE